MDKDFDLVIRGGTLVDGSGKDLRDGDVALLDGVIAEVGSVKGGGREELDARGKLITPGFIDLHTHYDGQITWDNEMEPSSDHGVTTILMGNCGVGFAPCRPEHRQTLIDVMEGVEDVPAEVLNDALPFNWETFPQYLDALDHRHADMNFATLVPHGPVRVYVMGKRAAAAEPALPEDMARQAEVVRDAVAAGALGFAMSRNPDSHRTKKGQIAHHEVASEAELRTIAMVLKDLGKGVLQAHDGWYDTFEEHSTEFDFWRRIAKACGRPLSFVVREKNKLSEQWRWMFNYIEEANGAGLAIRAQVGSRPAGMLLGLDLSYHPFSTCPTYVTELERLPLVRRLQEMRKPEVKRKLLSEQPAPADTFARRMQENLQMLYELGDPADYSPPPEQMLAARANSMGISGLELAYELLVSGDGQTLLFFPQTNFAHGNLDTTLEQLKFRHSVLGAGDAGAHVGFVCDASYQTHMLTYWTRDRKGERLPLPLAVRKMTNDTATAIGLHDRGLVQPGYRADINVIDYDKLQLHAPLVSYDLPTGKRRLKQPADGYVATIVNGTITRRDGKSTRKFPGRLIRGPQPRPVS